MSFPKITIEDLLSDKELAEYLMKSKILEGKRGGAFIATYDIAPGSFRKYGIILPKGGLILPEQSQEEIQQLKDQLLDTKRKEAQKKRQEEQEIRARFDARLKELSPLLSCPTEEFSRVIRIRGSEDSLHPICIRSEEYLTAFLEINKAAQGIKEQYLPEIRELRQRFLCGVTLVREAYGETVEETGIDAVGGGWFQGYGPSKSPVGEFGLFALGIAYCESRELARVYRWTEEDLQTLLSKLRERARIAESAAKAREEKLWEAFLASREIQYRWHHESHPHNGISYSVESWDEAKYYLQDEVITEEEVAILCKKWEDYAGLQQGYFGHVKITSELAIPSYRTSYGHSSEKYSRTYTAELLEVPKLRGKEKFKGTISITERKYQHRENPKEYRHVSLDEDIYAHLDERYSGTSDIPAWVFNTLVDLNRNRALRVAILSLNPGLKRWIDIAEKNKIDSSEVKALVYFLERHPNLLK